MRLKGRTAIITGAGSGSYCSRMKARLSRWSIAIRRDYWKRSQPCATRRATDRCMWAMWVMLNSQKPRPRSLWRHGRLDVLVTAAGFSCGGTVVTTDPADWDAVFRTNVGGTWLWSRAALPEMQRQGKGSIITLASQLAIAGGKGNSAYIAAKGAIISLTRTMAVDFATDGIRVNAIAPGAIDTPLLRRSFARHADPAAIGEASRQRHAMKRFGQAEEVAETALHLASDASSFTTGTVMVVDGGWLAA